MKKILLCSILILSCQYYSHTQTPSIDSEGGVKIGNTILEVPGTIRFNNATFEGYSGSQWLSLWGLWNRNNHGISSTDSFNVGIGISPSLDDRLRVDGNVRAEQFNYTTFQLRQEGSCEPFPSMVCNSHGYLLLRRREVGNTLPAFDYDAERIELNAEANEIALYIGGSIGFPVTKAMSIVPNKISSRGDLDFAALTGNSFAMNLSPQGSNGNSGIRFFESNGQNLGMSWVYDGVDNEIQLKSHVGGVEYGPHLGVERQAGNMYIDARLDIVDGNDIKIQLKQNNNGGSICP